MGPQKNSLRLEKNSFKAAPAPTCQAPLIHICHKLLPLLGHDSTELLHCLLCSSYNPLLLDQMPPTVDITLSLFYGLSRNFS